MTRLLTACFEGDERRRGRAHGELFRERVLDSGFIPYYRDFCLRFFPEGRLSRAAVSLAHAWLARGGSRPLRELAAGFAEGVGVPEREALLSLAMPDVLNTLAGLSGRRVPSLGCTSVAAWGEWTRGGRFLYGRNLDFVGVGIWDRQPLVARHRPRSGLPYVSVSAAGCIADGVTGINAEGLTVAVHQHYTTDVAVLPRTRPILDLAFEILRRARTIDEAVALCAASPTSSGWTIVLTHWRERRACALERAASRWFARDVRDGAFVQTNDYSDPALRSGEFHYPVLRASSRARAERALERLQHGRGLLGAACVAEILGDRRDPLHAVERVFAQAIAQPNNLVSVVFEPEDGRAWVAEGEAPVSCGRYRAVDLWSDAAPLAQTVDGEAPVPEAARAAGRAYAQAYASWEREQPPASLERLDAAVSLSPAEPYFRLLRGFLRLRLGLLREAADDFEAGAELPDIPHRRRVNRLWRARAFDAMGRRDEALSLYKAAAEGPADGAGRAARLGLVRSYEPAEALSVLPDFNLGDTYSY